jgi:cytochrome oxidase Cu insertion factor (SCO1/SenC/PrrC family)
VGRELVLLTLTFDPQRDSAEALEPTGEDLEGHLGDLAFSHYTAVQRGDLVETVLDRARVPAQDADLSHSSWKHGSHGEQMIVPPVVAYITIACDLMLVLSGS